MNFIVHDILSGELIPVLLGLSEDTVATARRMYRKYGVVSHVFCNRIPMAKRLSLCMKYHPVPHRVQDDSLLLRALEDFATQLGNADVILYLIPCDEESSGFVWRRRNPLETRFVIADREEMERVWFGDQTVETEAKA